MWKNGNRWVDNISGVLEETQCGVVKRSQWRALVNTAVVFFVPCKVTKIVIFFSV